MNETQQGERMEKLLSIATFLDEMWTNGNRKDVREIIRLGEYPYPDNSSEIVIFKPEAMAALLYSVMSDENRRGFVKFFDN